MSNQEILSFTQNLKKSEQMRIYRNLYSHMAEEEKKGCQETYKRLVEKRDLYTYKLVSWNFNESSSIQSLWYLHKHQAKK